MPFVLSAGDTPALFTACALEKLELVKLLMKHGASLSAEDKKQKIAAIHITADKGYLGKNMKESILEEEKDHKFSN